MSDVTRPRLLTVTALAVGAAFLLSGCELLYPDYYGYDEDDWEPGTVTTYETGSAHLSLTGGTELELDLPLDTGRLESDFGSNLLFRDDQGWALTLSGYEADAMPFPGFGALTVHRAILGHWAAGAWVDSCDVDVTQADERAFVGTASCSDMRWMDLIAADMAFGLPEMYIEGQDPFDAEITFAARAPTASPSPS